MISAPASNVDKTVVYGVNHQSLTSSDKIVSNSSCTTNCLAPLAKILNDNIGIERGIMTTIHSYTGDQPTLDRRHHDLYRARSAATSMIPTSTGAAKALGEVLPELNGKLEGISMSSKLLVGLMFMLFSTDSGDDVAQPSKGSISHHDEVSGIPVVYCPLLCIIIQNFFKTLNKHDNH